MTAGCVFNTWEGPGGTYESPTSSTMDIISANLKDRWLPYLNKAMAFVITALTGQNQSGLRPEQVNEGVNPTGQGSLGNSKPSS